MLLRLSKVMWGVSVLSVFVSLLYVYASLPAEQVLIEETEQGNRYASREVVFYISLFFILIINVLVYIIATVKQKDEAFRTWFNGLVVTLNLFVVVALGSLAVINGSEKYDYSRLGFFLYGSLGLIGIWCLTWPLWAVVQKKTTKD